MHGWRRVKSREPAAMGAAGEAHRPEGMVDMKVQVLSLELRQAEHFTMGLNLARSFRSSALTGKFARGLIDQARAWGVTGKA